MTADRTLHFGDLLLPGGWCRDARVMIRSGLVDRIETGVDPDAGDECHAIGVPGMPNLHSHAFQRGMAGLAEVRGRSDDSFWTWRETMYRFVDRIGPDELRAIAALAYVEMLESGFTRVGEFHYLHHDRDGAPFADPAEMSASDRGGGGGSGIGLTHLPVFYAHGGFGGAAPADAQRRFVHDIDGFARGCMEAAGRAIAALPDAVLGLAPHSLRAVMPDELAALAGMASGPIHIHIAEQTGEVEACLA